MNTDTNIPLLTDIIQLGDADMKNHFDGHTFNDDRNNEVANDNEFETQLDGLNIEAEDSFSAEIDSNDMPTIDVTQKPIDDIEALQIDLPSDIQTNDLIVEESTPLAAAVDENIEPPTDTLQHMSRDELSEMINLLVSDAVNATLPVIEAQLKQSISEQIIQKLARQIV